ncbi:MAG TPA: hypothetical protein VH502_05715 [Actinoplanes sp.]|jgi:hypothetical protein
MERLLVRCAARTDLDPAAVLWLLDRPACTHFFIDIPMCELEAGHDGPHAAFGQQCDEAELWIRWEGNPPQIRETPRCPYDDGDAVCLLFAGHPGRHSFELEAARSR